MSPGKGEGADPHLLKQRGASRRARSSVKIQEFRKLVFEEFGVDLDHATPANVREFLDRLQLSAFRRDRANSPRLVLDDPGKNYEEVVKDTFAKILKMSPEDAVPLLWIIAFELSFSIIEYQYSEKMEGLFEGID